MHQDHDDDRMRPTTVTATLPKWLADVATGMLQLFTHPDNANAGPDAVVVITGAMTHNRADIDKRVVKGWSMYETAEPRQAEPDGATLARLLRISKANGIAMGQLSVQADTLMRDAATALGSEEPGMMTPQEIFQEMGNAYKEGVLRVCCGKVTIGKGNAFDDAVENAKRQNDRAWPTEE